MGYGVNMAVQKRMLGTSDLEVAPVALGGNVFGWTAQEKTSFDLLDAFVDAGGNMIDTADVYSAWVPENRGGESETIIGKWLKRDPGKRDKIVIATKVGFLAGGMVDGEYFAALDPRSIFEGCDASLRRLGVETIDLYYHHKDNPRVPLADSLGAMDELVKAGKIRAIGLSQYSAPRLDEAMQVAKAEGLTPPCALQTWYNMVEREKLESELRGAAVKHGLGVVPFYSLANGFLAGKYRGENDLGKSPRGQRSVAYLQGRGMRILEAMDRISAESGAALATIALAWTKSQPSIAAALASATSLEQMRELTASLEFELSTEQVALLDEVSG